MFSSTFRDKAVWLSGSTGFKGSWLAEWLLALGARVHGFALPPDTEPALFDQLGLESRIHQEFADVRDPAAVRTSLLNAQPDFVFHLAAQALVRPSYQAPVDTYAVNVMGSIHLLEVLRDLEKSCAAVFVTTDKCYENREWVHAYREEDALGGHDPYSSSKAAAEIAISSWRRSFFESHPVRIASARAGNAIGGGDWAADRIVPDCIRALQAGQAIPVRQPACTRPWQHVLDPLGGYLQLAAALACGKPGVDSAFNFGLGSGANATTAELVTEVLKHWPGTWEDKSDPDAPHEAGLLSLATDKAHAMLGWKPVWDLPTAVEQTVRWYRGPSREMTNDQIARFMEDAERGQPRGA